MKQDKDKYASNPSVTSDTQPLFVGYIFKALSMYHGCRMLFNLTPVKHFYTHTLTHSHTHTHTHTHTHRYFIAVPLIIAQD